MKLVKVKDLKKGQIVLTGKLGEGNFDVAEVKSIKVDFRNWDSIDMVNGVLCKKGNGIIDLQGKEGAVQVLNSSEMIKVNGIKNRILMLDNLKEYKK